WVRHRRAHHRAGVELHLVGREPAKVTDVGNDTFQPVEGMDAGSVGDGRAARQLYLFGPDRDADDVLAGRRARLGDIYGAGIARRNRKAAVFDGTWLSLEQIDVADELRDPARRRRLVEVARGCTLF